MGVLSSSGAAAIADTPDGPSSGLQPDGTYRIYASSAGKSPGPDIKVLKAGTSPDTFVESLNSDKVLILAKAPTSTELTVDLDDADTTKTWFKSVDSGATASVTFDSTSDQNLQSLALTLSEKWPLGFSSDNAVLLANFGPIDPWSGGAQDDFRIPVPGINAAGTLLAYGLDFASGFSPVNAMVKDLFTYVGQDSLIPSLPAILPALVVKLDKPEANSDPQRNAVWFAPSFDMQTTIRLQFKIPTLTDLQGLFAEVLPGFTIISADAICKRKVVRAETEKGTLPLTQGSVIFSFQSSVGSGGDLVSMATGVEFSSYGLTLTILFTSADPLRGLLKWLASLIGDDLENFVNTILTRTEGSVKVISDSNLRRLTITLDKEDPNQDKLSLASLSFDIEVTANFGGGSTSTPVVFLISYSWNSMMGGFGTLSGSLWNNFKSTTNLDLLPYEERWTTLRPLAATPADSIQLVDLIPGQKLGSIPDTLPSKITRAYVEFSQTSFAIGGTVSANQPDPQATVPQPYLGDVVLDASFSWGASQSFVLHVGINAGIKPAASSVNQTPATLNGSLDYDSVQKSWGLQASISGLYASTLASFFDSGDESQISPLLDSIAIDTLTVSYTYVTNADKSTASKFVIQGDLLIATLRLSLLFSYENKNFQFSAAIKPQKENAKIGDVLLGILGSDNVIELPDFITNMVLVDEKEDAFSINIVKKAPTFQFLATLNIGPLHIMFAQLHSTDWVANSQSKRLIQVSINDFPNISVDIPLIGELRQPLDELYFLWVQDPLPRGQRPTGQVRGLLRQDLLQINDSLTDKILVKDNFKNPMLNDMLVEAGCHFAVIIKNFDGGRFCLLDYAFMKPTQSSSSSDPAADGTLTSKGGLKAEDDDAGGPSAQAPYKKKAGPLSISNVGLKYKEKVLSIMFDAMFEMGPVGFTLIGFSLGFQFDTLDSPPTVSVKIDGLSAAFEKPPLLIAGIIRHTNDGKMNYYAGGLIVGWTVYQFEAAGFYGEVQKPGGGDYKSIFVFAKLNGPLITLEFAEISGICGGFGYNSSVRVPTIEEVPQFPFIASSKLDSAQNALDALKILTDPGPAGWFQPLEDTYWLAVGMKVDAFKMLSFNAVVVVQFGQAIKLGLFALVIADVPTADSPIKLAHVELGLSAVADFQYGTLRIEAQLSPRSYILHESCHLTGGAGLYYWFDAPEANKALVGDFVFTLGGYHQAFNVPSGYPNPPRLGISWNLGGGLSIVGQSYFAITPKACMAGGRLHAAFKAGPIEAWFDAFADFLINYKPFHFNAQAGIAVGVAFDLKVWFIHIRISVEIGAQLYLWGPPVAGRVHVDFWIVGFDINFGNSEQSVPGISLEAFYELVLQMSESQSSASKALLAMSAGEAEEEEEEGSRVIEVAARPENEGHNFLAVSGLMKDDDKPDREPTDPWLVRAGTFVFVVACKMAIKTFKDDPNGPDLLSHSDVYGKPMKLTTSMSSSLLVVVQQDGQTEPEKDWGYDKHLKSVPRALWDKYNSATDPSGGKNNIGDLLNSNDGSLDLMMGVQLTAPPAVMAPDPFPAFDVEDASLQELQSERALPQIKPVSPLWAPAKPSGGAAQYQAVFDNWVSPAWGTGDDGQAGFVDVLAKSMKWPSATLMKSIAGLPERLKSGFMNSYVAAPMLTS